MGANEFIVQGRLPLQDGAMLRVQQGEGVVVYVWEGDLWLTQEGDRRDYLLRAGQWFRLDRGGVAVATALGRAVVSVTAPHPDFVVRRKAEREQVYADLAPA
jgi:hypothetical protein